MKTDLIKTVSEAMRQLRIEKEVSQEQLSKKSGVDRSYISRLELGIANPSLKKIERLVKALGGDVKVVIT